jgi:hypothetical protein
MPLEGKLADKKGIDNKKRINYYVEKPKKTEKNSRKTSNITTKRIN